MVYDVIIIGGGPAGSSAATYLRQNNLSVLILEKEKFPRDHVGESLIPFCYHKLKELGVYNDIAKFATYKPGVNFSDHTGHHQSIWCFDEVIKGPEHLSMHCLRAHFDEALLRHAEKQGAKVLEEHLVTDVNLEGTDNLVEVTANEASKNKNTFKGKFLLDASGQGTFLSKKFNAKKTFKGLDRTAFFCHWLNNTYDQPLNEGLIKIIYLGGEKQGWIWVIPVGPNHLSIGVTLNNSYVKDRKKQLTENNSVNWMKELYLSEVLEAKVLTSILATAELEHEVLTTGDYSYYTDNKFGKNYALIGDSGAFLDPIFSSGIYVAFESANFVTQAISKGFNNPDEMQHHLTEAYSTINGAYILLEKFIRLFYDSDTLHFAHIGSDSKKEFEGFKNAYEILHYLLAGDFFSKSKEYSDFIDQLKTEKTYKRFITLTKSKHETPSEIKSCGYDFEKIYGHLKE